MMLLCASDAVRLSIQAGAQFAPRMNPNLKLTDANSGSQWGSLMRIAILFSFVLLSAATLPADAKELPEHTVLAFSLPQCPKGWVEHAAAAGKIPGLVFCEKGLNRR
jgi:hypothetical protein